MSEIPVRISHYIWQQRRQRPVEKVLMMVSCMYNSVKSVLYLTQGSEQYFFKTRAGTANMDNLLKLKNNHTVYLLSKSLNNLLLNAIQRAVSCVKLIRRLIGNIIFYLNLDLSLSHLETVFFRFSWVDKHNRCNSFTRAFLRIMVG